MNLHTISSTEGAKHRRRRVGRGQGSTLGKTCGRGHKGQMARKGSRRKPGFEGGQMPLIRRIPKRGFNNPTRKEFFPVNVAALNDFEDGSEVTLEALAARGLAQGRTDGIKILGQGELSKKLTVQAHAFSSSARAKIEAAGGECKTVG